MDLGEVVEPEAPRVKLARKIIFNEDVGNESEVANDLSAFVRKGYY